MIIRHSGSQEDKSSNVSYTFQKGAKIVGDRTLSRGPIMIGTSQREVTSDRRHHIVFIQFTPGSNSATLYEIPVPRNGPNSDLVSSL